MTREGTLTGRATDQAFPSGEQEVCPLRGYDRRGFYDARARCRAQESRRTYHRLLENYYRFLIPPGARVLEVGCGLGDLLAAVQPSLGVGVDFSAEMVGLARKRHLEQSFYVADAESFEIDAQFDFIVLSDLVNDLRDVQEVLVHLKRFAHPQTRLV